MRMDWTTAVDDFLTERWQYCALCGSRPAVLDQALVQVGGLALATVRCLPCRNADPTMTALHTFLVRRYRQGKEES